MKKIFEVLICGLSAMNTTCETDMENMSQLSGELFN